MRAASPAPSGQASSGVKGLGATQPAWMRDAACAQDDVDLAWWFEAGGQAKAKSICARCPVLRECQQLVDEVERDLPASYWAGVWAGETVQDRRHRRGVPGPRRGRSHREWKP